MWKWITQPLTALVLQYAPELDLRIRPHLRSTNDSWRVDETYILRLGTVEIFVSCCGFARKHALTFCCVRDAMQRQQSDPPRKTLNASHTQSPRVINVDKNAAYPAAIDDLKASEQLPETTELRHVLYLNNRVEQEHRNICATDKAGNGIVVVQHSSGVPCEEWKQCICARIGQVGAVDKGDVRAQIEFVSQIFGVAQ